jgi:RNA polymerase sigma-70 factor (ECF subfamily)
MILRKRRKRAEVLFDFSHEHGDEIALPEKRDRAPSPEQTYVHYQQGMSLLSAIEKLEPKLRRPLEIHIYRDCSLKEIAQMLEISVPAVKARLHRARRRLARAAGMRDHRAGGHLSRGRGALTSCSLS